ncbi:MAG TPA: insulinase family protein [Polyangiaceae bacterium]
MKTLPVRELRLDNGMQILMVERHDSQILRLRFLFKRGASDAAPGVASFAAALMSRYNANGSWPPDAGSTYWVGQDSLGIDTLAITRWWYGEHPLQPALFELSRFFAAPKLDAWNIERERRLRAVVPMNTLDDGLLTTHLEHEALYPSAHPYHFTARGDADAANAINAASLQSFFGLHVQPSQLVVIAVGDFDGDELSQELESTFGRWHGSAVERKPMPELPLPAGPALYLLDQPGSDEARITVSARGPAATSPDQPALFLLSTIVRRAIAEQLDLDLREDSRHTSAFGSPAYWRGPGPLEFRASVPRERAADSLRLIEHELARLRAAPLSRDELATAARAAQRHLAMGADTADAIVGALSELAAHDRPMNDYDRIIAAIGQTSADDLQKLARVYCAPEKLRWFVVSDATVLAPSLSGLGLGPIQIQAVGHPRT